ncbi:MAG: hypothetical protein AW09_003132 [Candidatus Accumulibacter phosphatis]|uniref:Uncharacterized protein n=1 Tax=Candidatus Accumulibacter phosphatis TaxID=327160 RepID=A0A080LVH9_9PROT|nr:MAG: hypothetical protein AW09_003132 [Candidatus Accumulibacter phosphatis]
MCMTCGSRRIVKLPLEYSGFTLVTSSSDWCGSAHEADDRPA